MDITLYPHPPPKMPITSKQLNVYLTVAPCWAELRNSSIPAQKTARLDKLINKLVGNQKESPFELSLLN